MDYKCDYQRHKQKEVRRYIALFVHENVNKYMSLTVLLQVSNTYYYFVEHCGRLCGLKWRVWLAKMYFIVLK